MLKAKHFIPLLLLLLCTLIAVLFSTNVMAATTLADVSVSGLTVTTEGGTAWTASAGGAAWNGKTTSSGGCNPTFTATDGTLELTNTSGESKVLSFDYSVTLNGGTLAVDGVGKTAGGSFIKTLMNGESVTLVANSATGEAKTTSITLSNIKLEVQQTTITFAAPSNGSYTLDGEAVTGDVTKTAPSTTKYNLVATPADNYNFVGWYLEDTMIYESATVSEVSFTSSGILTARFAPDPLYLLTTTPSDSAYTKDDLVSISAKYFHDTTEKINYRTGVAGYGLPEDHSVFSQTASSGTSGDRNDHYIPSLVWSESMAISASGSASGECAGIYSTTYAAARMLSDVIRIYAKKDCIITFDYSNSMTGGTATNTIFYYITTSSSATVANVRKGTQLTETSGENVSIALPEGSYLYILAEGYATKSDTGLSSAKFSYSYSASISNFTVASNEKKDIVSGGFQDNTGAPIASGKLSVNGTSYSVDSNGNISNLEFVDLSSATFKIGTVPSNYTHIGWKVTTNGASSYHYTKEYTCTLTADCNVIALFAPHMTVTMGSNGYNDATYQLPNGNAASGQYVARNADFTKFYTSLADAFNDADTNTVILLASATINGDWEIPSGKTLVIPFGLTDQGSTTPVSTTSGSISNYCKVTLNGHLTVNGTLLVSAQQYGSTGATSGPIGYLSMAENSVMTVNGTLYAYGPVIGDGKIEATASAKIHEYMEIKDGRAGGYVYNIYTKADSKQTFPFNAMFVNNIEVPLTYQVGATLTAHLALTFETVSTAEIPILGESGAMFNFTSGTVTKYYNKSTGQFVIQINEGAEASTGSFSLSMTVNFANQTVSVDLNSADYYLPLSAPYRLDVNGKLTFNGNYKFLPGATLNVMEGGQVVIPADSNVVFYRMNDYDYRAVNTTEQWGFGSRAYPSNPVRFTDNGNNTYPFSFTAANVGSAKLNVDGLLTVSGGLYVTDVTAANRPAGEGITYKDNGDNFLTGIGTIDMTNAKSNTSKIYEVVFGTEYATEWVEVAVAPMKGLKSDATADEAEQYESLSGVVLGVVRDDGLNVWMTHPCSTDEGIVHTPADAVIENNIDATCTTDGSYDSVVYCSVCNELLSKEQKKIPATGHNYEGVVTPPTCSEAGYTTFTCSKCGDSYTTPGGAASGEHTYGDWTQTKAPTCTEQGVQTRTCTCGASETQFIDALGHEYKSVVTAPTCTENGYTTHTCLREGCTYSYTDSTVDETGHTEEIIAGQAATCTETGLTAGKKCTVCGVTTVEQEVIPKLAHTEQTVSGKAATCTETGLTDGKKCTVCGEVTIAQEVIPVAAHSEETIPGKAATCTATGLTDGKKCTVCGEITVAQEEIPMAAHTEETIPGKDATCTETGLTDGKKCSVCGETLLAQEEIPAIGHDEETVAAQNATCTATGLTEGKKCKTCGVTTVAQEVVPALGHTEETVAGKAATCTETGLTDGKKCSVCGTELLAQEVIPMKGHSWGEWYVEEGKEATEEHEGEKRRDCQNCGESEKSSIPALTHDCSKWAQTEIDAVDPTCTETGLTKGEKCSKCGTVLVPQEVVAALGHSEETISGKAATCTESGLTDGKKCTRCGETTIAQTEIAALGHTAETVPGKDATCTGTGLTDGKKCTVCGEITVAQEEIPMADHTEETIVGKAATCTETGLTDGKKCTACGEITVAQQETAKAAHTEVTVPGKAATCTATGLTDGKKCSVCGETTVAQQETAKAAHTEETIAGKAATCSATGLTDGKKCTVCGEITVAQEVIAKLAHTEEVVPGKAATCTATGLTEGKKCSACGETLVAQEDIPSTGHNYTSKITKSATCTEDGVRTYTCQNNAEHIYTEEIPATGHTPGTAVTENEQAATCTTDGSYDTVVYCSIEGCKAELSRVTTTVNKLGHSFAEENYKSNDDATCTADGTKTAKCDRCDHMHTVPDTGSMLGHDYKGVKTNTDCYNLGYTIYTCTRCSDSYRVDETELREHKFEGEGVVTPPTCDTQGFTTYTCKWDGCNGTKTDNYVPALGHTPVTDDAVAPDCTNPGLTAGSHCSVCGDPIEKQEEIPALGHTPGEPVKGAEVKPTCTEQGGYETIVSCTVCGGVVEQTITYIDPLGHTPGEIEVENEVKPTCTTAGSYDNVTSCSVCGEELSRDHVTVDELGHTEEIIPAVDATCQAEGSTAGKKCSVCGEILEAMTVTEKDFTNHTEENPVWIPTENGKHVQKYECCGTVVEGSEEEHVWGDDAVCDICLDGCEHSYTDKVTEPTCTVDGYTTHICSECGHTYKDAIVPAPGHVEEELGAVEATCTATGLTKGKKCTECGEILVAQNEIPAKGHNRVIDKAVAPTCTEDGLTEGSHCSTCGEVLVAQEVVTSKGHTEYVIPGEAATCTETGLTEGKVCVTCQEVLIEQEEISASGHSVVIDAETASTCTETGLTEGSHCGTCGAILVVQTVIAKLDHTEEVYADAKAPTCTETGLTEGKKCTVCGNITVEQKTLPANGHSNEESTTIEPTCATVGEKTLTCTVCGATSTKEIPATNNHDYSEVKCDKEYQWKKCATCDATNFKAPRTFRIVFQVGERGGDDDIVLPGVYFYGYDETFIVPEFKSNFFAYEYNWAVDGQKLEPGSTMNVSALASLISLDVNSSEWNTIYVPGDYRVSGLDPNAIMMSMQYENNTGAEGDIFLTLSIFVRVEPGMMHEVVQSGGTDQLTIKKSQVGNLGLYHYQIPLTAEQMNDENLKIKISYTENGNPVWFKEIGVNLTAYSAALNDFLGEDVTGDAAQVLVNATMAYGAAIQTMDKKDANGNVIEEGSVATLNAFNEFWRNDAKKVGLSDADVKVPEYSQEATYLTDSEGNLILDAENKPIPIARISAANVAMDKTYALLYRFKLNLPEGAELKNANIILTDVENALNDRTTKWDGTTGTSYTYESSGKDADGTTYYEVWVKNVPASEMTVRYATVYVEYTVNGTEYCAYSQTVKYGVITYLNNQIDKMLNKEGFVISNADDSDLKQLYLWDNLRTVAKYAEKDTKN